MPPRPQPNMPGQVELEEIENVAPAPPQSFPEPPSAEKASNELRFLAGKESELAGAGSNRALASAERSAGRAVDGEASAFAAKEEQAGMTALLRDPEVEHLRKELQLLVKEATKYEFVFKRLAGWYGKLQLGTHCLILALGLTLAIVHSISKLLEADVDTINVFVVGLAGVQSVVIGLSAHLDHGRVRGESFYVAKAYTSIIHDIRAVLAQPKPTKEQLNLVLNQCHKEMMKVVQGMTRAAPAWVQTSLKNFEDEVQVNEKGA